MRALTAWVSTVGLATALVVAGGVGTAVAANGVEPCAPVFIGVPGSGQNGFSAEMAAIALRLSLISGATIVEEPALPYEAIPFYQIPIPWNDLNTSEDQGVARLLSDIASYRTVCDHRTIMLAGYSQGAEVVIKAVDQLPRQVRDTLSIALLGNPSFTPNRTADVDYNKAGQGIRPSFEQGRYLLPDDVLPRTVDICAKGDPICSFRPQVWLAQAAALGDSRSAHYAYIKLGYTASAAQSLWDKKYAYPPPQVAQNLLYHGTVGMSYRDAVQTTEGRTGYWEIIGGSLPPGLTFGTSTGEITGTPTATGQYQFMVVFTDTLYGGFGTGSFRLSVDPPPLVTPPPPQPAGSGAAYSFGLDSTGELGQGITGYNRGISPTPIVVTGMTSGVKHVAAAASSGYALNSDGSVDAWGYGGDGELGIGNTTSSLVPVPSQISGVTALVARGTTAVALLSDGTIRTWGTQIVSAPALNVSCGCFTLPQSQTLPRPVIGVAASWYSSYALLNDGTVWAWGLNNSGQLGNGTTNSSWTPVQVQGLTSVVSIVGGYESAYALKADGSVWAWGSSMSGQLGPMATSGLQATPIRVAGMPQVTQIAASAGQAVYARAIDGSVWAWGDNTDGSLGIGTSGNTGGVASSATPTQIPGLSNVLTIGAGGRPRNGSGFAVKSDGTLWSWGHNQYGQLGYSTGGYPYNTGGLTPAQVPSQSGVLDVVGGSDTTYTVASG